MERRLAAILAADVVGYSRLMGDDEAGTLVSLRTYREELIEPKVADHRGRIVKLIGDGLLAEFPSAVEAVHFAVEIQTAVRERSRAVPEHRRIALRIGINIGDIVVETDDIFGDGVNVAARLEGLARPGGICISGNVYEQLVGKSDIVFEDAGRQTVKNIAKPMAVWRWTGEADGPAVPGESRLDKPSIAVLPFENMSGDPEQAYFSDGLTEDLITALTHWRSFPAIARNSSFSYKNKAVNVVQIARELGASYVLEGSVRKAGRRVRISVQLIDGRTGHHVWAERYDRDRPGRKRRRRDRRSRARPWFFGPPQSKRTPQGHAERHPRLESEFIKFYRRRDENILIRSSVGLKPAWRSCTSDLSSAAVRPKGDRAETAKTPELAVSMS